MNKEKGKKKKEWKAEHISIAVDRVVEEVRVSLYTITI
jgi:hypothetical protein